MSTNPSEAAGWYVDGATRRRAPLAPALELGADRVVVVGTGGLLPPDADPDLDRLAVDLGDAGATLLGAVMDDPLRHRPAAAGGAQRADGRRRARPSSRASPHGARPVGLPHGPLRRSRTRRRRGACPHCDAGLPCQPRLAPSHPRRPRPAGHAPVARQRQPTAGRASLLPLVRPRLLLRPLPSSAAAMPSVGSSSTPTCGGPIGFLTPRTSARGMRARVPFRSHGCAVTLPSGSVSTSPEANRMGVLEYSVWIKATLDPGSLDMQVIACL